MTASVQLRDVAGGYGPGREVFKGLSFELGAGLHVVVGQNGSGKTTFLRMLAGVLRPLEGEYLMNGKSPYLDMATKSQIGYAPHRPGFYLNISARENLQFWAKALGLENEYSRARIEACARDFGLSDMLDTRARLLSRGKAQRLAIARAVLAEPLLLVLDEPAEGLDPAAVQSLNRALETTVERGGMVFYSSHHVADVAGVARTIVEVVDGAVRTRPAGGSLLQ